MFSNVPKNHSKKSVLLPFTIIYKLFEQFPSSLVFVGRLFDLTPSQTGRVLWEILFVHFNNSQLFIIATIVGEKKLSNLKDEVEKTTPHKLSQILYRL